MFYVHTINNNIQDIDTEYFFKFNRTSSTPIETIEKT